MYCSPIAETLLTVAVTFSGTGVPLLSRMWATTPSSDQPDRLDPADRDAAVGDVGVLVQPAARNEIRR